MSEYKRLTNNNRDEYDPEYDFCIGCKYFGEPNGCNRPNGTCSNYERFIETYNRLAELEDKIENGTLIEPKYPLYSIVFIIDYINEEGYSVYGGKPIVRECFVTSITQMIKEEGKLLYRVQPKDLPNDVLEGEVEHCEYWERAWWEKDLFPTIAEAEARLKEFQEKRNETT